MISRIVNLSFQVANHLGWQAAAGYAPTRRNAGLKPLQLLFLIVKTGTERSGHARLFYYPRKHPETPTIGNSRPHPQQRTREGHCGTFKSETNNQLCGLSAKQNDY
jgi:hypothetical protein